MVFLRLGLRLNELGVGGVNERRGINATELGGCCTMTSRQRYLRAALCLVLLLLCERADGGQGCPEKCACFETFASCYQFTEATLRALPKTLETLVLRGGKIHSFPQSFLKRFPQLSSLEIQSTEVETLVDGTFSEMKGMDQLAIVDSQVGSIESGAFRDAERVSQIFISNSHIGTIQVGAFSALSNVEEFSVWSSTIEEVKQGAFRDLSDIASFTFYLNNVTDLSANAFQGVRNFGKVEIYQNQFTGSQGSAVVPLTQASNETNVFSNTLACECGNVQAFHRPEMLTFLASQTCTMPDTGEVLALSEVNVTELCINQPTTPPPTVLPDTSLATLFRLTTDPHPEIHSSTESSMTQTYPTPESSTPSSTSTQYPVRRSTSTPNGHESGVHQSTSSTNSHESGRDRTTETQPSTFSHGTAPKTMPTSVSGVPDITSNAYTNDVTSSAAAPKTVSHPDDRNGDGERSQGSSKSWSGAMSPKQASFVSVAVAFTVAWLVSIK